jgi:hypothetical protein
MVPQKNKHNAVAALTARVDELRATLAEHNAQLDVLRSKLGSETVKSTLEQVTVERQNRLRSQDAIVSEVRPHVCKQSRIAKISSCVFYLASNLNVDGTVHSHPFIHACNNNSNSSRGWRMGLPHAQFPFYVLEALLSSILSAELVVL